MIASTSALRISRSALSSSARSSNVALRSSTRFISTTKSSSAIVESGVSHGHKQPTPAYVPSTHHQPPPTHQFTAKQQNLSQQPFISDALRAFSNFDTTPATGTEFRSVSTDGKPVLSIKEVMQDTEKLRALAHLIAERGVVFFRAGEISAKEQRELVDALGKATHKPASSTLHVHPLSNEGQEHGDEIAVVSNHFDFHKDAKRDGDAILNLKPGDVLSRPLQKNLWHTDITFEPVPSDYACLSIRTFPREGGGDTLWASAYEAYDRLSPAYQRFLEGMTATHTGQYFIDIARKYNLNFRQQRGSPDNTGDSLSAVHPVIRTNPVTGWKGLFVNKEFTKRINQLTPDESDNVLNYLFEHISANHDLHTRFRWEPNSLAIWDNRSSLHAATYDLDGATREGTRACSVGERPYFDANSVSRRAALAAAGRQQ